MTELQERIDLAKIHLYTFLLEKETARYTQTEAEIAFFLSGDRAIQEVLDKPTREEVKNEKHNVVY